jgi:glycosyltransferase involved in cell wall biosynthesis
MSNRHKILFISHDASLTGAPRELLYIVKHIDKSKFEPVVILGKDGPLRYEFEKHARVIVQELFEDGVRYLRELPAARKRVALLREINPALVYCNTVITVKWLLYAKLLHLPTVLHIHELKYVFDLLSRADRFVCDKFSDRYIAASSGVRNYLSSECKISEGKIDVFHESLEISPVVPPRNEQLKSVIFPEGCDLVVGMVGRIVHMKGTDSFIKIARMVREHIGKNINVKFLIVGGAAPTEQQFYDDVKKEISAAGLINDVVITGFKDDVPGYLSLIDVFVLPSREDPFPLVVLEAMASGLPVVAFAVGGVPEALTTETGVLIEPGNLNLMSDAIVAFSQNPERRIAMGAAARRYAEEHFDIARNIGQIEKIITSLINPVDN